MCSCNPTDATTEEYHTAFSEFEESTPQEWRTSTQYYDGLEDIPGQAISTPPRSSRQDFQRTPRAPPRSISRRRELTTGVAIVPRRIDFDAITSAEDSDDTDDLGFIATDTLQRLRSAVEMQHSTSYIPKSNIVPGMYGLRRTRPTRYPSQVTKQYAPRMTRVTPCGKCLRI